MGSKLKALSEKLNSIKNRLGKKTQLVVAIILSLIMLIIFVDALKKPKDASGDKKVEVEENSSGGDDYILKLESRLENLLSSINGVNGAEVFIMTETSVKTIYLSDEKNEESGSEGKNEKVSSSTEIVFSKDGSKQLPIVEVVIYPEITGVLIVADTKKDEKTRLMLLNAVSVALGVNNSKIEVLLTDNS